MMSLDPVGQSSDDDDDDDDDEMRYDIIR